MTLSDLFQRFIKGSPISVMVRATLERILTPETIDGIFAGAAVRQHQGELLFSSVVNLLAAVVWRQRDSINQAYKHAQEKFDVSVRSVYNKLNGTEIQVCRELVRQTAQPLVEVVDRLKTRRPPQLKGYHARIIDGNHLASTEHRLKVLRRTGSGPLPGQALAVLDPDRMLIVDLFPCEDGEAQERRIFSGVISSVQPRDLWIGDRNFCTTGFLFGIDGQGGSFVIRQHASTLSWETETKRKRKGRGEKGTLFEQQLHLQNGSETLVMRCITVQLDEPTRFGETEIRVLTNLPQRDASARKVAALYLERWTIENAFQEIEQSLRSEIDTLGYPGAVLLGFSIAVMTYNALSVAKWAIEKEHDNVIQREEVSGYYLASAVAADYGGMMIALPAEEWTRRFSQLSITAFIKLLRECARHVRPDTFRKTKRGPKKPRPKRPSGKIHHHVSTARLLAAQKC